MNYHLLPATILVAALSSLGFAQPSTFTSPIDITGSRVRIRAVAPDRESGRPADVPLPASILGPRFNQLLSTPLSAQFDQYWGVTRDPTTKLTAREQACTGKDGIAGQIDPQIRKIGPGFSAYDVTCDLATTGQLFLQQQGARLTLAYQLTRNKVDFKITTPGTCKEGHGTFLCPNDPRISVTFATQMITVVRAGGLCEIVGENATVVTQGVAIDGNHNLAGAVLTAVDDLFAGHKFRAAERSIENTEKQRPLPLDAAFKELRDSDGCTGKNVVMSRVLKSFRDFETMVDRQALTFQVTHPPIPVPGVQVPNPGVPSPPLPTPPTFTPPTIAADRPAVQAGSPVGVNGRFFPPNLDMTRSLPVSIGHNTGVLGGPCFGGGTDLRWGPVGKTALQRLPGTAQAPCAGSFSATNLTPFTAYEFSARNCDAVTCSLWSRPLQVRTARVNPNQGKVVLTLDGRAQVGSGVITDRGTFEATVTIPASTVPGTHRIRAVNEATAAQTTIAVTGAATAGAKASIMMVGVLKGETGCPNHPIGSTAADANFMLFGTGFQAGAVTVRLDTVAGLLVGNAVAQGNGTFCQKMNGVPASQAGNHRLVAVQNGAIQAQLPATFVIPSGVR